MSGGPKRRGRYTHEVGASWDRVASDDRSANASDEFLAGHDLLAHQVAASLGLDLVLDVAGSETGADVLGNSARNHGGTTEAVPDVSVVGR